MHRDDIRSCFDIYHIHRIGAYVKNRGNAKCCGTQKMLKSVDAQFKTSFLSLKLQKCNNSRGGLSLATRQRFVPSKAVRQGEY